MPSKMTAVTSIPALALALVLGASGAARADLVTNGSFEQSNLAPGHKETFASADVTGWTINKPGSLTFLDAPGTADNGSYLSVYGPFPKMSPDGGNFVEGDGDPHYSGTISQTLQGLTVGQKYAVTFFQAAGQQLGFTGPTTEAWSVSLGGETHESSVFSLPQGGVGPWQAQSLTFTATQGSEVLSFLAVGTPGGAPPISFLDGVHVNAVPEPASLLLIGAGLFGAGAFKKFRRVKSASI